MAVSTVEAPAIDPKTSVNYAIRLGNSISKPTSSRYTSVCYNYKPKLHNNESAVSSIRLRKESGESGLSLSEGGEKHSYAGRHRRGPDDYVLIPHGTQKSLEWTLEKVGSRHVYNLTATPTETATAKLAKQHPQVSLDNDAHSDTGNDMSPEESADPSNPFDYRHFLKAAAEKPKAPPSTAGTPRVQARPKGSTSASRPKRPDQALFSQRKRKGSTDVEHPDPKRVKAGEEPSTSSLSAASRSKPSKADAPKIRLDRKASLRKPSYVDSGELILENETPISEKPSQARSAMSLALSGQLGPGPISLRSAASSPASMMASPMPLRPDDMDEEDEFELGSPEGTSRMDRKHQEDDDDGDADEEDEDDADVEDLELPSPAQAHKPSVSAAQVNAIDDEDDLGKELALALGEDDGGSGQVVPDESEEESEEE